MAEEIDRLEIQVEANARDANSQLDVLISSLNRVNSSLRSVGTGGIKSLANSINTLSTSIKNINPGNMDKAVSEISKLSSLNTASMASTSEILSRIGISVRDLGSASTSAVSATKIMQSLSRMDSSKIEQVATSLPRLATSLKEVMEVLSTAPEVSNNIIRMTNALSRLQSSINTTTSSVERSSSGMSLFKGILGEVTSSSTNTNSKLTSISYAFTRLYATVFTLKYAFSGLSKIMTSPLDFLETVNYYNVAMRQIGTESQGDWQKNGYTSAETYADSFQTRLNELNDKMTGISSDKNGNTTFTGQKNVGLDINQTMNAEAQYGQMAKSLGVTGETALATAKAFTMLGEDWSSLKNISLDSAWTKFASVLAGQSRAVQSLGISTQVATLQEYAYKYGITQSISTMNQAEKTQLRLLAVLDQSKVAYGDLANTINSPRNQLRLLDNNFNILARTIGNLFVPVIQAVLPYLNGLVIAAQRLFAWLGKLIGIDMKQVNSSIGGANNQMAELSDGTDDVAGSLDNAAKSAKKLQNVLSPIDELNILNYSKGDSGSSGSGAGSVSSGFPQLDTAIQKALANYDTIWNEAFDRMTNKANDISDNIVNAFKNHDYSGIGFYIGSGVGNALNTIDWKTVYSVASQFGSGFAQFLNGLITPALFNVVGKTIAGALNTAVILAFSFGKDLNWTQIGESIAAGVNSFFQTFDFSKLAQTMNTFASGIFNMTYTAIKNINWISVFGGIATFIGDLNIGTVGLILGGFTLKMAGKILTSTILREYVLKQIIEKMAGAFSASSASGALGAAADVAIPLTAILVLDFLAVTFGDKILQAGLKPIADSQADILGKLAGMKPEDIAKTKKDFDEQIKDFHPYQDIINELKAELDSTPSEELKRSSEKLKKAKDVFNELTAPDKKSNQTNTISEWATNTSQSFSDMVSAIQKTWNESFAPIFSLDNVKKTVKGLKDGISETWGNVEAWWVIDVGNWWTNDVASQFTQKKWDDLYSTIGTSLSNEWNNIVLWWEKSTLVTWWTDDVEPWFTKKKWDDLYFNVGNSLSDTWTNITIWWEKSALVAWFTNDVEPWFTAKRWTDLYSNIQSSLSSAWDSTVSWWDKSALVVWFTNSVEPWFSKEKWSWSGIKDGLSQAFDNAISAVKNIWNGFAGWMNSKLDFKWDDFKVAGKTVIAGGELNLGKLPTFQTGGFPEDGLFSANSHELVGQFSNGKTAVANNGQIIEGIKAGVADAMMNVFMATRSSGNESNTKVEIPIYLDGKEIARSTATNLTNLVKNGQITLGFI